MRKLLLIPPCLFLLSLAGCEANDDAGNVAFVEQATQVLLCRKPRGAAEVNALTAVAQQSRDDLLDVLMNEPEFADCWVPILADTMQMQREGEFSQKRACINSPRYVTSAASATLLADFLRSSAPTQSFTVGGAATPWNLNDALRAAILVDDLHVAWRPWLFAAAGRPWNLANPSADDIRDNYLYTVLNVRTDCVSCHSSTYSKTEAYPLKNQADQYISSDYRKNTWDRTSGFGFDLHGAAFAVAQPMNSGWDAIHGDPGAQLYYNHCTGCHGEDGTAWPWVNEVCPLQLVPVEGPNGWGFEVVDAYAPKPHVDRVPLLTRDQIVSQILTPAGCMPGPDYTLAGEADPAASAGLVADYMQRKLGSYEQLGEFTKKKQFTTGAATPWGMSSDDCDFLWAPGQHSHANGVTYSFGGDAYASTDAASIAEVLKNGIAALPNQGTYAPVDQTADPDIPLPPSREAGVALLLAFNIADDILEQLSGGRGTVPNTVSRTEAQSEILRGLVSQLVVSQNGQVRLSLKHMLKSAFKSSLFNRRAPVNMAPATWEQGNTGPYQLDMYVNPWAATQYGGDVLTGDDRNGQGDLVHRRSPVELTWSLHHDLGWPAPSVDPAAAYPSHAFVDTQLGRYQSAKYPGTTVWQLDSLLFWEKTTGACENPTATADFIDVLTDDAIANHGQSTIRDLALVLKDRLLQEAQFTTSNGTSEETLVSSLFNGALAPNGTFTTTIATYYNNSNTRKSKLKKVLRQYCGALVESPDYVMANLPTVTAAPPAPPWSLCLPAEQGRCTQSEQQTYYCQKLTALGRPCP